MLSAVELIENLDYYDAVYSNASGNIRPMLLASKASILEVCGWVEQAMDGLVADTGVRCALSQIRNDQVKRKYIEKTYGFVYEQHFERMLISVVGYRILEKVEATAGQALSTMTGTLSSLSPLRNHYAHTHFDSNSPYPKNMTGIPAPTLMRQYANDASAGLSAIENALIALGC